MKFCKTSILSKNNLITRNGGALNSSLTRHNGFPFYFFNWLTWLPANIAIKKKWRQHTVFAIVQKFKIKNLPIIIIMVDRKTVEKKILYFVRMFRFRWRPQTCLLARLRVGMGIMIFLLILNSLKTKSVMFVS